MEPSRFLLFLSNLFSMAFYVSAAELYEEKERFIT